MPSHVHSSHTTLICTLLSYSLSPHQQVHLQGKTHLCLRAVPQEVLEVKEEGGGAGGGARDLAHLLEQPNQVSSLTVPFVLQ